MTLKCIISTVNIIMINIVIVVDVDVAVEHVDLR